MDRGWHVFGVSRYIICVSTEPRTGWICGTTGALWIGGRRAFEVGRYIIKCFDLASVSSAVSAIPDTGVALVFLF